MINVLIVEDDPDSAAAHVEYVRRVAGYAVAGHCSTGLAALQRLIADPIDLLMLDIYLPDIHGLEILRRIRSAGLTTDVMVMTRARDLKVVHAAMSYGATQYLVKPFTFSTVRKKLEQYRTYHQEILQGELALAQSDIDHVLAAVRDPVPTSLPKGVARESLAAVAAALESVPCGQGVSAVEAADILGASKATARRYLEHLCEAGLAERHTRYGSIGRPEMEYRMRAPGGHSPLTPPHGTPLRSSPPRVTD
jgi:response regulator of citrate/malate metabolism